MTHTRKLAFAALAAVIGTGAVTAVSLPAMARERGGMAGERLFDNADADHDGRVTPDEAWSALSARFAEADTNKDGGVTPEEFRAYVMSRMSGPRAERAAQSEGPMEGRAGAFFRALDADRDGKVTLAELRPFADAMFRARDANGDNVLTRDEMRPRHARAERPASQPSAPAPTLAQ